MAIVEAPLRIRVTSTRSFSGTAWSIIVAGECQSIFTGANAKARAVFAALKLTEELWAAGPVLLVVESLDRKEDVAPVARPRLAS